MVNDDGNSGEATQAIERWEMRFRSHLAPDRQMLSNMVGTIAGTEKIPNAAKD
jgi:hypothetical protein